MAEMRIGYAKLGRALILEPEKWGAVGGDNEGLSLLLQLAERHPEVTWVVTNKWNGDTSRLPRNIEADPALRGNNDAAHDAVVRSYDNLDAAVGWLGQHGTSNNALRFSEEGKEGMTSPHESSRYYCAGMITGFNRLIDEGKPAFWLCGDPRNYLKARDIKWYPPMKEPIIGQFDMERAQTHWRWDDPRTPQECDRPDSEAADPPGSWKSQHCYAYEAIELVTVPRWEDIKTPPPAERKSFGIVVNENRTYVSRPRAPIIRDWVVPLVPDFIYGQWTRGGQETIGWNIEPVHYRSLHRVACTVRSTLTTPASGSGWATAKPWEMAALGVICFAHPLYDTQGHIIPTLEQAPDDPLVQWLRPQTPEELRARVDEVASNDATYVWLRDQQLELLAKARRENRSIRLIEERLGLEHDPSVQTGVPAGDFDDNGYEPPPKFKLLVYDSTYDPKKKPPREKKVKEPKPPREKKVREPKVKKERKPRKPREKKTYGEAPF